MALVETIKDGSGQPNVRKGGTEVHKDRQAKLALSYVRIARRRVREYINAGSLVTPGQLIRLEHMMWNAEMLLVPWQSDDEEPLAPLSTMEGDDDAIPF